MGYRIVTYTYLDCPACGTRIGSGDKGSPFRVGPPFKVCQACQKEPVASSSVVARLKLLALGIPERPPLEVAEPAFVEEDLARLRARLAELKGPRS
jgi:hypothetical protein